MWRCVIGANDVVNPTHCDNPTQPYCGNAQPRGRESIETVVVLKRGRARLPQDSRSALLQRCHWHALWRCEGYSDQNGFSQCNKPKTFSVSCVLHHPSPFTKHRRKHAKISDIPITRTVLILQFPSFQRPGKRASRIKTVAAISVFSKKERTDHCSAQIRDYLLSLPPMKWKDRHPFARPRPYGKVLATNLGRWGSSPPRRRTVFFRRIALRPRPDYKEHTRVR